IKNEIEKITQNDIVVTADMNGINAAGNYKLDLNVTTPSGISVIKKSSTEITVTVDKTTSRSIPIKVDCSDYVLDSSVSDIGTPTCLPTDYIQVTGPQKIVDSIDRMLVKLNIDVIKESINYKNCTVVPVDKNGNVVQSPYIKLNQATVDVHIPVYKEAEVEVIPVYSDELNYIISYSDFSPKIVTIRGTVEAVNSVDEIYTETIDVEKAKPVINASLNIPSGITVTDKSGNPVHSVRINGFEVRPLMTVENKPEIDE
ncbi:MAG: hypothetical protein IJZ20_08190, partial [Clostridia bacterium]|nr:hypothetical protein [Clostridia bacterium]